MNASLQLAVSFVAVVALPLFMFGKATAETRRLALGVAVVYLATLALAWLSLPQATGVDRWPTDYFFLDGPTEHNDEAVVPGVLKLRSIAALGVGVAVAAVARQRRPFRLLAVALLFPILLEAATELWWCIALLYAVVPGLTRPLWVLPTRGTLLCGATYFGGPVIGGAVAGIAAEIAVRLRPVGARQSRAPANPALQPPGEAPAAER